MKSMDGNALRIYCEWRGTYSRVNLIYCVRAFSDGAIWQASGTFSVGLFGFIKWGWKNAIRNDSSVTYPVPA